MITFRKDINGLRALAVISVVLYHFDTPFFSGGFSGVDIFFVISGFLMTGIIQSRLEANNFSFIKFYLDRAKRIIPALSCTCLLVFISCWFFLTPTDFETLGRHIYSSLLFISNIIYFKEINYFDASASQKWLLHTWSLSVEWQFYMLLPLLMFIVYKINRKAINSVLQFVFIVSLTLSVYFVESNKASEAFYLLPARAWEMVIGGLVYLNQIKINRRYLAILHYISIFTMVAAIVCLDKNDQWPGLLALIPVSAAAVFIASGHDSWISSNPVAQFIGKISYSVYLFHWPVVVALNYFGLTDSSMRFAGIILSFILGAISYNLIENQTKRVLNQYRQQTYKEIIAIILILLIPFGVSAFSSQNGGFASRFPYALLTSEDIAKERARYWVDGDKEKPVPANGPRKIVIIGNSHGVDLTYALTENGLKGDITYLRTTSYCSNFGFTPNYPQYKDKCPPVFHKAVNNKALNDADVVFMHDDWAKEDLLNLSKSLNEYLSKTKAHIYVIGPKMTYTKSAIDIVANSMDEKKTTVEMVNEYSKNYYSKPKIKIDKDLKTFFSEHKEYASRVTYISAMDIQCGNNYDCKLLSEHNKSFYYFDAGHFTLNGSINFGSMLKSAHPELFL
ncbi:MULTISPECIES: acyltransferase family protein [Enterobacter]|uniref:acyltransferase family protein n=1 Tax=Enterobacter TaxID=547 RepID=UPI00069FBB4A|nr:MULTISPECIES: acyltransferase family protein [Enterobacter cloacae complex]MCW4828633.1 acyltransferase [Enterobacter hormaechei subsp. xiangfangensis]MCW4963842.1 acyltransferase [Enterobacter hormaechei subsp. xiangfangensis]MEB8026463.1 acyltransferase [Enterobacter hormaechei]HCM9487935.1 acyltransferase [Enterobacter hormaechei subsp. xiangfangensis]